MGLVPFSKGSGKKAKPFVSPTYQLDVPTLSGVRMEARSPSKVRSIPVLWMMRPTRKRKRRSMSVNIMYLPMTSSQYVNGIIGVTIVRSICLCRTLSPAPPQPICLPPVLW